MRETKAKYDLIRLATNSLDQAVLAIDMHGRIEFANAAYMRLFGHSTDDIIGLRASEILPLRGDTKAKMEQALAQLHADGRFTGDFLVCNQQGEPKWVTTTANVVTDINDDSRYIVATFSDITTTKIHETLQHRVLHDFVQGKSLTQIMHVVCREVQELIPDIRMSVSLVSNTGCLDVQAAPDLPQWYCDAINGLEIGPVTGSCGTTAWTGKSVNVANIHTDPLWAPYREIIAELAYNAVWSTPIKGADGTIKGVFAFYSENPIEPKGFHWHIIDICVQLCRLLFERAEAQERVRFLAQRDSLTGLHNRSYFQEELAHQIDSAKRSGQSFAVHLIDLDSFKDVNDRYGHLAGDALLANVAKAFGTAVGAGDTLARLGGDEFALLQTELTSDEDIRRCAGRLIEVVEAALDDSTKTIPTSASIGYACFPADGRDAATLFRNADLALYDAKKQGRGRACAYTPSMTRKVEHRRRLEDDLRAVLANESDDFHLVFQPQFRLADNKLVAFEVLARWRHPELGIISPDTFIPIAEEGGLIAQLGTRVLLQACQAASAWPSDLYVAVNLSPVQFGDGDLPHLIHSVLIETGLSPKRLELEVTENLLIEDQNTALHILRRLSAMGVAIALDDFGTGYASLSYLHTFPFDKIKIDRSFVTNLEVNPHSRAIVDAVLRMCESIGIPVIAEGVETAQQLEMLIARRCGFGQGYFLSPPVDDVGKFLEKQSCGIIDAWPANLREKTGGRFH